ncbi:hypothetical protein MTR72_24885 [Bradyrhizobium sp. ISRA442]|uniref:hypothetical protein n=1 Tax=Bradyrhizobium sp. ISRA442 TaxID=2866197 RepID=UPI00311B0869
MWKGMKCLPIVLALAVIGTTSGTQAVADNGAQSAECKEITARLIELTGTTFDHYSPSGDNVFFKKPDMHLSCMNHRITGVSLNWDDSGFPPNAWFTLLATAGKAVTGVDARTLESASHKCHRAALKEKSELADLDIPNAKIECQAFTRDGGGVNIHIWINDHEARKGIEEPK